MGAELGKYKACVSARSTDKEILKHAQDGGIVTSLFGYALDAGIIDGAIVAATKDFAAKHPSHVMRDNSNFDMIEPLETNPRCRQLPRQICLQQQAPSTTSARTSP